VSAVAHGAKISFAATAPGEGAEDEGAEDEETKAEEAERFSAFSATRGERRRRRAP